MTSAFISYKRFVAFCLLFSLMQSACIDEASYLKDEEPLMFKNKKGSHIIYDYARKCAGADQYCLNVSVLPATDSLPSTGNGNIFVAKSGNGLNAFTDTVMYSRWLNDSVVQITYNPKLPVLKKENKIQGIRIEYREM